MKKLKHLKELWDYTIKEEINRAYQNADSDFVTKTEMIKNEESKILHKLQSSYLSVREELKENWYGKDHDVNNLMDMHKYSAVICSAILNTKPIVFDTEKAYEYVINQNSNKSHTADWIVNNVLINYRIAFNVATMLVYYDTIDKLKFDNDGKEINDNEIVYNRLIKRRNLFVYKDNNQHESFVNSTIFAMAKNDQEGKDLDCLFFANILYQLQEYALLKLKYEE